MPNSFAYIMLIGWPLISIWLYKKQDIIPATFWTIVGGYLMLPIGVDFDFPLIPALNKMNIPVITAFLGCKYLAKRKITIFPPKGLERYLIILFFIGSIGMVVTNGDSVNETYRFIPGLSYKDTFSVVLSQLLLLLPFILGLQLIRTYEDQVTLLKLLVTAGLIYSVFIMFEIRMSPQLHKWIYGFFPHTWGQQVRYGGFRPVVFLGHGLWVSIFLAVVLGGALALAKIKVRVTRFSNGLVISYLMGLLIIAKGFGAIILGSVLLFGITFLRSKWVIRLAFIIAAIAITYPLLCILEIFPHDFIVSLVYPIDSSQAGSLQFRFNQEVPLLERAKEKIIFGWGGWDRNRLVDSVTDGYWIILFGKYGLIGFSAIFGLMFTAVHSGIRVFPTLETDSEKYLISGHCLVVAIIMVDQIPNHSINPLFWFLIGALVGRADHVKISQESMPLTKVEPA